MIEHLSDAPHTRAHGSVHGPGGLCSCGDRSDGRQRICLATRNIIMQRSCVVSKAYTCSLEGSLVQPTGQSRQNILCCM